MAREKKELSVEEFREYARTMKDNDHPLPELTEEVLAHVVRIESCYTENNLYYADSWGRVIVELSDGRGGLFSEWSDSSGHG